MGIWMMQGDQYALPFALEMLDGTLITDKMVKTVVLNLGSLSRQYPGDVTYENGKWLFSLTQQQTFAMKGLIEPQARVEFENEQIFGGAGDGIDVQSAFNKGTLGTGSGTGSQKNRNQGGGQTKLCGTIFVRVSAAGVQYTAEGAVRYDVQQDLTEAEKAQARQNIGADEAGKGSVRYDIQQNLTEKEQRQARENIGAGVFSAADDGNGNIVINNMPGMAAADDGDGNLEIYWEA